MHGSTMNASCRYSPPALKVVRERGHADGPRQRHRDVATNFRNGMIIRHEWLLWNKQTVFLTKNVVLAGSIAVLRYCDGRAREVTYCEAGYEASRTTCRIHLPMV